MRIGMIGTGYVGLVTGTCLAETGNDVVCMDRETWKIEMLRAGRSPIYEPGLQELIDRNLAAGRLGFTTSLEEATSGMHMVFIAVGTPPQPNGSVDLSALWAVVDQMAQYLGPDTIVVIKSTVPVGTNAAVTRRLKELTGRLCYVASNPEFLKEGTAVDDFMKPDRVVVGARSPWVVDQLHDLYRPYLRTDRPFLAMSPESAEMTKYAANAMLATKISFINEIALLCELTGADVDDVRRGIGHDERIGFAFLFPGVGYGGSCLPKDVQALTAVGAQHDLEMLILRAVHRVNVRQREWLLEKIRRYFDGHLAGRVFGIWGLSFKPGTDDLREAPSLFVIEKLQAAEAAVQVHDPVAMENARRLFGDKLRYCQLPEDAADGADALIILTEWKQFVHFDLTKVRSRMNRPVIFDGRNLYDLHRMRELGFDYVSVGRPAVFAAAVPAATR
ncbi:MAG: UDP-glucose/GDP-mannose dehydrogenase family protein [Thermoguttaceae bacterium]|nr:UDP-glucose/GDP-mannose dehydrogenase family protein [Thermoguttaceae bacterium]MDW8079870.1 UDP-glucose/GDP-mannose dehydrogenase family protein [Thermoguttaceae bacterium]